MRKLSIILAAAMLLSALAGCTVPAETTHPAETGENPSASVNNTGGSAATTVPVEPVIPSTPENPGNTLVDYDPERDIYFFSDAHNFTIYQKYGGFTAYMMYIVSKNELDLESMELSIPVEATYAVKKRQMQLESVTNGTPRSTQFPYWLYQCYMGKDFAKLRELDQTAAALSAAVETGECTPEEAAAAYDAYVAYSDAEWEAYGKLTEADLPQFYVYHIGADFNGGITAEEVFNQVELTVGGEKYTLPVGECRLGQGVTLPAELDWYRGDYTYATHGILGSGNAPTPYNDGLHRVSSYFSFTVKENMTVTDLVLENPNQKLEKVWINMVTYDGLSYIGEWDLSEPLELYEGDRITFDIAYREEGLEDLSYHTSVWGFLIYECDEGTFCKLSECNISTDMNYYEMYAIIFDGLDLEGYYRDYYYPTYEPWRQEITN